MVNDKSDKITYENPIMCSNNPNFTYVTSIAYRYSVQNYYIFTYSTADEFFRDKDIILPRVSHSTISQTVREQKMKMEYQIINLIFGKKLMPTE